MKGRLEGHARKGAGGWGFDHLRPPLKKNGGWTKGVVALEERVVAFEEGWLA